MVYFYRQLYYRVSLLSPPITMNVYALMGCLFCIGLSIGVVLAVGMLFVYQVRTLVGGGGVCSVVRASRVRFWSVHGVLRSSYFGGFWYFWP